MKSQAQRAYLWANHPDIAKRWEKETPKGKLPKHVKKIKNNFNLVTGRKKINNKIRGKKRKKKT